MKRPQFFSALAIICAAPHMPQAFALGLACAYLLIALVCWVVSK